MPRFKNDKTGVVVNVSDESAVSLSGYWVPVESEKAESKPTRKTTKD